MWQWTTDGGKQRLHNLCSVAWRMKRSVFTDGSCSTQLDPSRRRAGWAVVEVADHLVDGEIVGIYAVWGTLPAGWPQSPQAGEFAAVVAAAELVADSAGIYSDCQSVVDAFHSQAELPPAEQLHPQQLYAGAVRSTLAFPDARLADDQGASSH